MKKVLAAQDMSESKPVQTLLASHFRLNNLQCPITEEDRQKIVKLSYANVVGCLIYAMVLTRLDIAHAISIVSKYMTILI